MTITSISRDTNNNVSLVRMISIDTILDVQSENYILNNQNAINSLNGGTWQWFISDMIVCWCSDGVALYTFTDSSFSTLIQYGETGGDIFLRKTLNLSDVASRISSTQNLGLPTGHSSLSMLGDVIATNPPDYFYSLNPSTSDENFKLPIANASNSMQIGNFIVISNDSPTYKVVIKNNSGSISYINVYPGETYTCTLTDNSTSDGTWLIGPYKVNINNEYFLNDQCIQVISNKTSCICATTGNLDATYDNATNGRLSSLTANSNGAISIDGISPSIGERILVKNQTSTYQNGIYFVSVVGDLSHPYILDRSYDYQPPADDGNELKIISPGDTVTVAKGNLNSGTTWMQTETVTTVGTDPILFSNLYDTNPIRIVTLTTDYTLTPSDNRTLFIVTGTGTITITVPAGSTLFAGFTFTVNQNQNDTTLQVLIVPSASNQIDFFDYGVVGFNGSVTYTLISQSNVSNITSTANSGFFIDLHPIVNTNIATYTLKQSDNGSFIIFPDNAGPTTLTLPINSSVNLNKGFWCEIYNPSTSPDNLTISSSDSIEGPTSINPGMVAKAVKRVYGSGSVWVVTVRYGTNVYTDNLYATTLVEVPTIHSDSISSKTADSNLQLSGNGTGLVQILDGLIFPTSGGTPSSLTYYEVVNVALTFKGPFADQVVSGKFVRIGDMIVMGFSGPLAANNGSGGSITCTDIPSRFYPNNDFGFFVGTQDNTTNSIGIANFASGGTLTIFKDINFNGFGTTGDVGVFNNVYCSYIGN